MSDPRFPIGRFAPPERLDERERRAAIEAIAVAPARLRATVTSLSPSEIDTPYRPGGWTARQIVHHVPDSHLNAYVRFKLALTEDEPTIKPYDQSRWAELPDARNAPIETSLVLLEALHARWVALLGALQPQDFARPFLHPESGRMILDQLLALYAWHGRHHTAQVESARAR